MSGIFSHWENYQYKQFFFYVKNIQTRKYFVIKEINKLKYNTNLLTGQIKQMKINLETKIMINEIINWDKSII